MSPLTAAQQAFLDQMKMNRVDDRALRVMRAAFIYRNNLGMFPGEKDRAFAEELDKVAG